MITKVIPLNYISNDVVRLHNHLGTKVPMTFTRPSRLITILLLAILPLACESGSESFKQLPGMRLFSFNIEVDGISQFKGVTGVMDGTPDLEIWDALDQVEFTFTGSETAGSNQNAIQRRTLAGKIVVSFAFDETHLEKRLESLTLRSANQGESWSLDESQIQRIKAAKSQPTH
jgi:hypothetical protein